MKRLFYFYSILFALLISACSIQRSADRKSFETASQGNVNTELNGSSKTDSDQCWVQSHATPLPASGKYVIDINNEDTQLCPVTSSAQPASH